MTNGLALKHWLVRFVGFKRVKKKIPLLQLTFNTSQITVKQLASKLF